MLASNPTRRSTPVVDPRALMMKAPPTMMRPLSTATEMFDVDVDSDVEVDDDEVFEQSRGNEREWRWRTQRDDEVDDEDEDDDSDFEEELFAGKRSFESEDGRRRSQTTLSSYDEVPTPDRNPVSRPFDMLSKPVEGPRGPHLFRSSQSSAEFAFEHALQMSPLIPIKLDLDPAPPRRDSRNASVPPKELDLLDDINDQDAQSIIRRWSPTEVTDWMTSWDIDPSVVHCFEKHDINGAVLLDLQFEHLRELDIESFGKRHQLWNAICILRGDDEPSLPQEVSRPSTRNTSRQSADHHQRNNAPGSESEEVDAAPMSPVPDRKKRRGRKESKTHDTILPGESVSIVAIEQLLPKPHSCSKGKQCSKWQKQQAQIQLLQEGNGIGCFPISPTKGTRALVPPPSPAVPASRLRVPGRQTMSALPSPRTAVQLSEPGTPMRPTSEAVPSVVASSDLLGPGQLPAFMLQADMLEKVEKRDPQDNVRNFLNFQHMNSPTTVPPTPPSDLADGYHIPRSHSVPAVPQMFPTQHHQAYPSLASASPSRSKTPAAAGERLKGLPKLDITRSASAAPDANSYPNALASPRAGASISRNATASPAQQIYRLGTPASEMDVPVTAIPAGPVSRDHSQSVPPNMQYRQQTQSPRTAVHRSGPADWRRPSLLPAVKEGEVFPPAAAKKQSQPRPSISTHHSTDSASGASSSTRSSLDKKASDPAHNSSVTRQFGYGSACTHAGWMKKRRTKMLRHEWQEAHFRLMGSQLNMHDSARLTASLKDSINVDDYAVACSALPTNSKLTAAMRAFHLGSSNQEKANQAKEIDPTSFAFQLVPEREKGARKFAAPTLGKTHHFAVKSKDERIDWMREIMLSKALQQRGKGYDVEVNGVQA